MNLRGTLVAALLAGRIADALAGPDPDVEAAVAAYEEGDFDAAKQRLARAIERRGERPELLLDRGLIALAQGDREAARADFERATEAADPNVRASAHYELGNLAFDAQDWDGAIAAYVACLKLRPDHDRAKWNLEIALSKKEEEAQQQQQQQQQDQPQPNEQGAPGEPDENAGQESQQGEPGEPGTGEPGESGAPGQPGEPPKSGQRQDPTTGEPGQGRQEGQGTQSDEAPDGEPDGGQAGGGRAGDAGRKPSDAQGSKPEEAEGGQEASGAPQGVPIDRMDIDRQLDELDREDPFVLGRPGGGRRRVKKDW